LFFGVRWSINRITNELYEFIDDIRDGKEIRDIGNSDVSIIKTKFHGLLHEIRGAYDDLDNANRIRKVLQVEFMQTSINQHMLYNSLSALNWRCVKNSDDEMADMLQSMANYYRTALSSGNTVITLREELQLIREYVKICELSYSHKFKLEINVSDGLLQRHILKLLLQPIVENAIAHGLKGLDDALITIDGVVENDIITIRITDNGRGMPKEKLDLIMTSESRGYGLMNTSKRAKIYYGEDCGLMVDSVLGEGTTVTLKIIDLPLDELMDRVRENQI